MPPWKRFTICMNILWLMVKLFTMNILKNTTKQRNTIPQQCLWVQGSHFRWRVHGNLFSWPVCFSWFTSQYRHTVPTKGRPQSLFGPLPNLSRFFWNQWDVSSGFWWRNEQCEAAWVLAASQANQWLFCSSRAIGHCSLSSGVPHGETVGENSVLIWQRISGEKWDKCRRNVRRCEKINF